MKKPKYKDFDQYVTPVIRIYDGIPKVKVVVKCNDSDETTTSLCSTELRELANYLDSIKR